MHTVLNPKASGKIHLEKIYISANIIGINLQTVRSQIRLFLKEQPNTDPKRSTEMTWTTQQTQKADDLVMSDTPRVKGFIR